MNIDIERRIHPFFSAPISLEKSSRSNNATLPVTPDPSCSPSSDRVLSLVDTLDGGYDTGHGDDESGGNKRKRLKTETSNDLNKEPRPKRRARTSTGCSITSHFVPKTETSGAEQERPTREVNESLEAGSVTSQPPDAVSNTRTEDVDQPEGPNATSSQKPKKLLKLNPKTGTIGSPPKSKPKLISPTTDVDIRPPKSKRGRKPKQYIIYIKYGKDEASCVRIGQQIEKVLNGVIRFESAKFRGSTTSGPASQNDANGSPLGNPKTPKKRKPRKTTTPKKPPHPFFNGTSKPSLPEGEKGKDPDEILPKRHTIFTSTPCSPRPTQFGPSKINLPPSVRIGAGGLKVPGAQNPPWPWSGITHVRGEAYRELGEGDKTRPVIFSHNTRKAKGHEVQLGDDESIIHAITSELGVPRVVEHLKSLNNDDFQPPAQVVRIPTRYFESGKKLQDRVMIELRTLSSTTPASTPHPAIAHYFDSIRTSLSAFDRSTCETIPWTQKYAPSSAAHILQCGREAELLRDWLQTLKVQSVDTGSLESGFKSKATVQTKKRRKRKKLEGFVVSSDEEEDTGEISGSETDWLPNGSQGIPKKTVLRCNAVSRGGLKDTARLINAVVLSGPHGCGKTATVFAIAKELDFEVFEVHSGARRSGKDILERVGDMTQNHLVQHQHKDSKLEDVFAEDDFAHDIKSGKQGMMTSFFKPKAAKTKNAQKEPPLPHTPEAMSSKDIKKSAQNQKQSLILLEEVDVLYEEDKQFWTTVISMIAQSKRPFIMTCNDETLVPLQTLSLHGIFRFSQPRKDLAVDLLLLLAANEGHSLRRHPVETLYDSRTGDLRASITELNYWCQIGVGDLRGGCSWFYPRWPRGSDIDEEGHTIRVVSKDTYHTAMGWLNRDSARAASSTYAIEEELHQQTWNFWGLDVLDDRFNHNFSSWVQEASDPNLPRKDRLEILHSIDAFAEHMSDSDIYAARTFSTSNQIPIDAMNPAMPHKSREDFVIGRQLLDAPPISQYGNLSLELPATTKRLAQIRLQSEQSVHSKLALFRPLDESHVTSDIEKHISKNTGVCDDITRVDLSLAFDPIATSEKTMAGGSLEPSVFDRAMDTITLDVAPYVRSIVAYDQRLQQERLLRSNLLSEGGKPSKKRMRSTRSALSALEGGQRASTRREKYFSAGINPHLVMRTGGKGWDTVGSQTTEHPTSTSSPPSSSHDESDGTTAVVD